MRLGFGADDIHEQVLYEPRLVAASADPPSRIWKYAAQAGHKVKVDNFMKVT